MAHTPAWVRVRVRDRGGVTIPCACRVAPPDATEGRGLAMVDMLAGRWGFCRDWRGTTVCFEFGVNGG